MVDFRDCIPIPCTFSPWSDWQQPTCEGLCTRSRVVQARCFSKNDDGAGSKTLTETNVAPENGPSQKGNFVVQPLIFSGELFFSRSVFFLIMVQVARFEVWSGVFVDIAYDAAKSSRNIWKPFWNQMPRNVCRRLVPNQTEVRFCGVESTLRSCPVPPKEIINNKFALQT